MAGLEALTKKIDDFKASGKGIDEFMQSLGQDSNTKELLLKTIVEKMLEPKYLLQFARLDREMSYYICKHLIILNFFHDFYMRCEYRIRIAASKKHPFYQKKMRVIVPSKREISRIYGKFVNELLQLTIAYEGKGREELVNLFKSLNQQFAEDIKKQGFLQRFGLVSK